MVIGLVIPCFRDVHHGDELSQHLSHAIPAQLCTLSSTEWDYWESCTAAMWGRTYYCQVLLVTSQLTEMLPASYIPLESRCIFILPWKQDYWSKLPEVHCNGAQETFPDANKGQTNTIIYLFNNPYPVHAIGQSMCWRQQVESWSHSKNILNILKFFM